MKYTNKILAGMLIFIGTTLFLFGIIISEALYPGYQVTQVISDLGVGPTAWLFNSTIFIFGISFVVSAYLLLNIGTNRYFTVLLGLAGLGAVLVGLLPETLGFPHAIAAGMVFLCGGFGAITGYYVFRGPFSLLSPLFGVISLLTAILFVSHLFFGLGVGGMERMITYPLIIWALGSGAYLMSPGK
jgi:hypothetical membrane protein